MRKYLKKKYKIDDNAIYNYQDKEINRLKTKIEKYKKIEYDSNNADRRNLVKNFAYVKDNFKWENVSSSTIGKVEESVDDIRRNAPEQFKLGNRLVTTSDWEYYIRNRFKDNIVSVIC